MYRSREQHLIDLMFEVGLKAYDWHKTNPNVDREEVARWIGGALRGSGFDVSAPVGSSWGRLISHEDLNIRANTTGSIRLDIANRPTDGTD